MLRRQVCNYLDSDMILENFCRDESGANLN